MTVINGQSQAAIKRQMAELEAILVRQEVRLARKVRKEIIALWRRYNDFEIALDAFEVLLNEIIVAEAQKTAEKAVKLAENRIEDNNGGIVAEAILVSVGAYVIGRALTSASQITQTERENLERLARVLAADGLTTQEIAAQIRDRAPSYSIARARLIAETEVAAVSDAVFEQSIEASGLEIESKVWIASGDNRVRESHRDANNQVRPYDQPFDIGGERLPKPRDGSLGASLDEIINCRCVQNILLAD